jgi:hypothetical protein
MIVLPDSVSCGRLAPPSLLPSRYGRTAFNSTVTAHLMYGLFDFLPFDRGVNQLVELLWTLSISLGRRKILSTISRGSRCSPFSYAGVSGVAPPIEPLAAARSLHPVRQDFMYPHTLLYQLSSGNCDASM